MERRAHDRQAELLEGFTTFLVASGHSQSTAKAYVLDVAGFLDWIGPQKLSAGKIPEISVRDVRLYCRSLKRDLKNVTVGRKVAALNSFVPWAGLAGLLRLKEISGGGYHAEDVPKSGSLDSAHTSKLLSTVAQRGILEEQIIIHLAAVLGLRVSEICSLDWGDVDLSEAVPTISFGDKDSHNVRTLRIPHQLASLIRELSGGKERAGHSPVFTRNGQRITRRAIRMLLERVGKACGLTVTPRTLRGMYSATLAESARRQSPKRRTAPTQSKRLRKSLSKLGSSEKLALLPVRSGNDTYQDLLLPDIELIPAQVLGNFITLRSRAVRDHEVRTSVLKRANGCCESCAAAMPRELLEVHHIFLAKQKIDREDNCAALCPNCHRLTHWRPSSGSIESKLLERIRGWS